MTMRVRILWLGILGACASVASTADQPTQPVQAAQAVDPRIELAKKIPGTTPDELHASPIPGMWEVVRGTDIAYVTSDGKYAISPVISTTLPKTTI